jgi:putative methionine-R-sulfoxide reductase with GAF domain
MSTDDGYPLAGVEDGWRLAELATVALAVASPEAFVETALPAAAEVTGASTAFLYAVDPRLPSCLFSQHGLGASAEADCRRWSADLFPQMARQSDNQPFRVSAYPPPGVPCDLVLYPVRSEQGCAGLLGLAGRDGPLPAEATMETLLQIVARALCRLIERADAERQLSHLNTYLTVSSMLAQEMGLHELLEITLYCCMEAASAASATVLLLDDEGRSFGFYHVEGPAKPLLKAATFPADRGIAGSVLRSGRSEIVNDVQRDPRWYRAVDLDTGILTRNMIAVPLVAGEEKVGVLEVLNKAGGESFDEDEHLLLVSVAEEIAFAIRNARVFEYVVNTYCKQRQGQRSCSGCERPLRSWTPCVKYREVGL